MNENQSQRCKEDKQRNVKIDRIGLSEMVDVVGTSLYLTDYELDENMPVHYYDLLFNFALPQALPGGSFCMMNAVSLNLLLFILTDSSFLIIRWFDSSRSLPRCVLSWDLTFTLHHRHPSLIFTKMVLVQLTLDMSVCKVITKS
jgi:hypothetical protein